MGGNLQSGTGAPGTLPRVFVAGILCHFVRVSFIHPQTRFTTIEEAPVGNFPWVGDKRCYS